LCETECVCLTFECYNIPFCILGVYRHPKGNKKHFIRDLERTIMKTNNKHITYLMGDINIDLMKFDNNPVHNDYTTMLFSNNFMSYITFPTRITPYSATLIDHIFIRAPNKNMEIISGILFADISDHLPCFVSYKLNEISLESQTNRPRVRLFGDKQSKAFAESMNNFNWDSLYQENNDWYERFISSVHNIFVHSFPLVTVSKKRIKDKIWITKGLKISCKTNSKLYKKYIHHPNSEGAKKYPNYNKILRKCIDIAETSYHADIFKNKETSVKQLWNHLNSIINCRKSKKKTNIEKLNFKGNFYTND